jgi:hypothetical protein
MTNNSKFSLRALAAAAVVAFSANAGFAQSAMGHTDMDLGWTGRTTVLGSHSSIADTAASTREHQVGQY